jgi:hypothetical protein
LSDKEDSIGQDLFPQLDDGIGDTLYQLGVKRGTRRIQTSNDNERFVAESSLFSSAHLAMACAYSFGSFFTNHKSVRGHQTTKEM